MNVELKWLVVKRYCSKINTYLYKHSDAVLFYEGMEIPFGISINEEEKEVRVNHGQCSYVLFRGNPEYDEGAYTEINVIIETLKRNLCVYKKVNIR